MPRLFKACAEVLWEHLCPMHYAHLTDAAYRRLGERYGNTSHRRRAIEDVREKMLMEGRHDTFYIGQPLCLGAIRSWFRLQQLSLFNDQAFVVKIPVSFQPSARAAYELHYRGPHMINKVHDGPIRWMNSARGFVLQENVAAYFQRNWPRAFELPDNHEIWTRPCKHDFKINVCGQRFCVDVAGPRWDGKFGQPKGGKSKTDLHFLTNIEEPFIILHGFVTGDIFEMAELIAEQTEPISRIIVALNCEKYGIDWHTVTSSV